MQEKAQKLKAEVHDLYEYDKWNWLAKFNPDERTAILKSSILNGVDYAPWIVEHGIVNIIQQKLYEDPEGFPKLSESQSKRFE